VPQITIVDVVREEGALGARTNLLLTVRLSDVSEDTITVNYTTEDIDATIAGADYELSFGILTFLPDDFEKTIVVTALGDATVENDETFRVRLSSPVNATIGDGEGIGTISNDDDPTPDITISDVTQAEGETGQTTPFVFTVSLAGPTNVPVGVDFQVENGTALLSDGDLESLPFGRLNFVPGQTQQTVTVLVTGDRRIESDESFFVNLSNPSNGDLADQQGQGTITNDDTLVPAISITDVTVSEGAPGERTRLVFDVTLSGSSEDPAQVSFATQDGTAKRDAEEIEGVLTPSDYEANSGVLDFAPGETSKQIVVIAVGDLINEGDELLFVNLSGVTGATLADGQGRGLISNDDGPPEITISDVSRREGSPGEKTRFDFTVSLSGPSSLPVSVEFTTGDGTGTLADTDYEQTDGTVTVPAGETSATVPVNVLGDGDVETDESFFVTLSKPINGTLADDQGLGTILNDDRTIQGISIADVAIEEGAPGLKSQFIFTVELTGPADGLVTVDFATTDGTATTVSGDYDAASGTVTFGPGESSKTIVVSANGDDEIEADETFFINLSNVTGNAELEDAQSLGRIINDDRLIPTISIDDVAQSEGRLGERNAFTFVISLSNAVETQVTVDVATSNGTAEAGLAAAGGDYEARSLQTLTFLPGETRLTYAVTGLGDFTEEASETFFVNLSNASDNAEIADDQGLGTLRNDDGATPSIFINDPVVEEGIDGQRPQLAFILSLSGPSTNPVSLKFDTADGTASGGIDYERTTGRITFAPGELTKTVRVPVVGDFIVESSETVFLNLSEVTAGIIDDDQGRGTIINDDSFPTLSITDVTLQEGSAGARTQYVFTVSLTGRSPVPVTANFATADGTATVAGNDYQAASGTLTFLPDERSKQIAVNVTGDGAVETDETFFLNLTNVVNADTSDNQGLATISNDDALKPRVTISDVTREEGGVGARTRFEFVVSLSSPASKLLKVDYQTADGLAVAGNDYEAQSGTLEFLAGESSKVIAVNVLGDSNLESIENLFVNLSINPANADDLVLADDQGLGQILNDDEATPGLSIRGVEQQEGIFGERTGFEFLVQLSSPATGTITVDYATADGSARAGQNDYVAQNGTVTFLVGESRKNIVVPVIGDGSVENDEAFFVNLANVTGNAVLVTDQGTANILNDDRPRPDAFISDVTLDEGVPAERTRFEFLVTLSAPATTATGPIRIDYATADGTAMGGNPNLLDGDDEPIPLPAGTDYESRSGSILFQPGEQQKPIVIIVRGDGTVESEETFFLNLTGDSGNVIINDDQAIGRMLNDDFEKPGLTISDVSVVEGLNGARTQFEATLRLSANATTPITVNFATADGSATLADGDYLQSSGQVTFNATELEKTLRFVALGDSVEEANESFFINLSGITSNALLIDDQAEVTIVNDDLQTQTVVPDVTITDVEQREGDNNALPEFGFVVELSAAPTSPVTVSFGTSGGTADASDFRSKSGTVTFQVGETLKTIDIEVVGDETVETDEVFFVDLTAATGATIIDPQGEGRILNDDVAVLPGIRINDIEADEGSDGGTREFLFTVELTGVFDELVTVQYESAQFSATSTAADRDFFRIGESTLFFEPGEIIQTIVVQTIADTVVEPDEKFFINLFDPVNAEILDDQGVFLLNNDDLPIPQASINSVIKLEGDGGDKTYTFTVQLDKPAAGGEAFEFTTVDGTATAADNDYTTTSGTLTFAADETKKTLDVIVRGDLADEIDEQFFVNLFNPMGLALADDQGRGVIANDDDPDAILVISDGVNISNEFGQEGNEEDTTYEFEVRLVGKPSGPVSVAVNSADGTAIAGEDYNPVSQQLVFAAGETTKTVQVTVSGDTDVEADEEFFLNLSNATGARIFDDQGRGLIINDEDVVNRDEGLDQTLQVIANVMRAIAETNDPPPEPGVIINTTGVVNGGRSDVTNLLVQIGLQVIRDLELTDAIVAVFDPVNAIVTTPEGRSNGFTEAAGMLSQSANSFYSGDGPVELLVIPNASAGVYNLQLEGVGQGNFRAAVSRVDGSGVIGTETIEGNLTDNLVVALDFTVAIPGEVAAAADGPALASAEQGEGDGNVGIFSVASTAGSSDSDSDDGDENAQSAAEQIGAAIAAAAAEARAAAAAVLNALPQGLSGAIAGLFGLGTPEDGDDPNEPEDDGPKLSDLIFEAVGGSLTGAPVKLGEELIEMLAPLLPFGEDDDSDSEGEEGEGDGDADPVEEAGADAEDAESAEGKTSRNSRARSGQQWAVLFEDQEAMDELLLWEPAPASRLKRTKVDQPPRRAAKSQDASDDTEVSAIYPPTSRRAAWLDVDERNRQKPDSPWAPEPTDGESAAE
jgi:disulfide oxidoreductase YuzD